MDFLYFLHLILLDAFNERLARFLGPLNIKSKSGTQSFDLGAGPREDIFNLPGNPG
jgi:hypothetical protein